MNSEIKLKTMMMMMMMMMTIIKMMKLIWEYKRIKGVYEKEEGMVNAQIRVYVCAHTMVCTCERVSARVCKDAIDGLNGSRGKKRGIASEEGRDNEVENLQKH